MYVPWQVSGKLLVTTVVELGVRSKPTGYIAQGVYGLLYLDSGTCWQCRMLIGVGGWSQLIVDHVVFSRYWCW